MRKLVLAFSCALVALPAAAEVISVAPRDADGLVAAIERANRSPGEDIIELAAGSLYALRAPSEAGATQALPTIRSRIRILGNKAEIRRYADEPLLLLTVAPAGSLRLEHLTLAEGARGALVNRGEVELHHVRITDNTTVGAESIVSNYGTLRANDSEISFNQIAGAQRDAGIVLNYGRLELRRSLLSANTVSRRYGSLVSASAVLNYGEVELRDVRVTGNAVDDGLEGQARPLVNLGNGALRSTGLSLIDNFPASE
jgi:hypothetical protein